MKAYNLELTQTTTANKGKNVKGTAKITFKADTTIGGRAVTRTVVAQGAAADLISKMVRKGATMKLRCLIEHAPANEDGKRGGEYLTVVGLPTAKAA